jgi:hypothetical protein
MSDPYSRVYWRFQDEFPDVYADDRALALWLRLLILADGSYPAAAALPRKVDDDVLAVLVSAELLTLIPGDRYRVRGLDAERERRAEHGRTGGLASANARRTIVEPSLNGRQPRRDETRKEETSNTRVAQLHEKAVAAVERGEYVTYALALEAMKVEA